MNAAEFNNKFQNKINVLNEEKGEMTLIEYHKFLKENDPTYLSSVLGGCVGDYGQGMTEDDKGDIAEFETVISNL